MTFSTFCLIFPTAWSAFPFLLQPLIAGQGSRRLFHAPLPAHPTCRSPESLPPSVANFRSNPLCQDSVGHAHDVQEFGFRKTGHRLPSALPLARIDPSLRRRTVGTAHASRGTPLAIKPARGEGASAANSDGLGGRFEGGCGLGRSQAELRPEEEAQGGEAMTKSRMRSRDTGPL
jgi:hypothetical protein